MPKTFVNNLDNILVKLVDFCNFLSNFSEDWKIEGIPKDAKIVKTDVLHGVVKYDPIRCSELSKLRRQLTDKWFQVVKTTGSADLSTLYFASLSRCTKPRVSLETLSNTIENGTTLYACNNTPIKQFGVCGIKLHSREITQFASFIW